MNKQNLTGEDYSAYYQTYIDHLPQENLINLLKQQKQEMMKFLKDIREEDLQKSYAPGKWTVAQVLQHMFDTERIFQYRALRIARKDKTPLPGFDQDSYVPVSFANERTREEFLQEYRHIRESGVSLFSSFDTNMLMEKGIASDGTLSVAAAGFIIAGHEKHHLNLFQSLYNI